MRRFMTAVLTATLGSACTSAASRAPVQTGRGPDRDSGPHDHERSHSHHGHGSFVDANAWSKVFDDPARDDWQRPDDVLRALELLPTMTVADIGAGTGYFAVRLARAVPRGEVIATDLQPDMVRFLNDRALRDELPNLRAVQVTEAASGLAPSSVDRILAVHVWHHLAERGTYARDLAAALRPGGRLFVVDFTLTAHRGPPADMRIAPEMVVAELERAGLSTRTLPIALPDQYIVEARRQP